LRGRHKELLELLDRSGSRLFALLMRLTLREDIAEELMQELFIKLGKSKVLKKIVNWDAYVYRAAINLAFDWRRCNERENRNLEKMNKPISKEDSPLAKMIHSEELQRMLDAVGRLNKTSREVLVMHYIQQESYEIVAERLSKTPQQVRALCSKAINQLRNIQGIDRC
jgi:RNA polymerase sigma factor (sigma-70 family)